MAARGLENSILLCIDVFDKDPGPIDGIKRGYGGYTGEAGGTITDGCSGVMADDKHADCSDC